MTVEQSNQYGGKLLQQKDCRLLIETDADIFCADTGKLLAKFRKDVIPTWMQKAAYENLKEVARLNDNRGMAAGIDDKEKIQDFLKTMGSKGMVMKEGNLRFRPILKNGKLSKQVRATPVNSGVVGYMDRSTRHPNCRQTAFNAKETDKFKKAYPIIKLVDEYYKELIPDNYALQRMEADNTSKDFIIPNTAFTTVTVNKNWQTAVHKDAGDYEQGFGNLVAMRGGKYTGGHLVLVRWGVGFDLQNGDLLLMDVHEWHGNTPIKKVTPNATRVSLVMYYRKNMINCGTAAEELERAKNRKLGSKLND